MPRSKPFETLSFVANLIDPFADKDSLEKMLKCGPDWDEVVRIASQHLVLPTLYYQLKRNCLLDFLPKDLATYLNQLSQLNHERNEALIRQVADIQQIFQRKDIQGIFVKGAALLVSGAMTDEGERMVGDIDILVKTDQCQLAHDCLKGQGYFHPTPINPGAKHLRNTARHLPRLHHSSQPAGVEIHHRLLQKDQQSLLNPQSVLAQSRQSMGISIPAEADMFHHAILNWEINDLGNINTNLSLRSVYDALIILKFYKNSIDLIEHNQIQSINKFLQKCVVLYPNHLMLGKLQTNGFTRHHYAVLLKWPLLDEFNKTIQGLFRFSKLLINRLRQLIFNKAYRKDVFNNPAYALQACHRVFLRLVLCR